MGEQGLGEEEGSEEEEEHMEQDGALATSSLVGIILDGAEDLLTLEEAYNTLLARLRMRIPLDCTDISPAALNDIQMATRPILESPLRASPHLNVAIPLLRLYESWPAETSPSRLILASCQ